MIAEERECRARYARDDLELPRVASPSRNSHSRSLVGACSSNESGQDQCPANDHVWKVANLLHERHQALQLEERSASRYSAINLEFAFLQVYHTHCLLIHPPLATAQRSPDHSQCFEHVMQKLEWD